MVSDSRNRSSRWAALRECTQQAFHALLIVMMLASSPFLPPPVTAFAQEIPPAATATEGQAQEAPPEIDLWSDENWNRAARLSPENDGSLLTVIPQERTWYVERAALRFGVFVQNGRGYQSQAGAGLYGPGSEETLIVQPMGSMRVRQDSRVTHDITIPVDVVSSASTDALDAISSASRENEAGALDWLTTIDDNDDLRYTIHAGVHVEEPLRSGYLGLGFQQDLAEDNAVFAANIEAIVDVFDPVQYNGYDPGLETRFSGNANVSLTQLLSETTVARMSYGVTFQHGVLQTTWNSVPLDDGQRLGDLFPEHRLRHAFSAGINQAIPASQTYFEGNYRFYVDDFGLIGNTLQGGVTQYLTDTFSLRGTYRFHKQNGVNFFATRLPTSFSLLNPRTSDSDLAPLDAHEVGGYLRWYYDTRGALSSATSSYVELSYLYYGRSNSLEIHLASVGWGHAF